MGKILQLQKRRWKNRLFLTDGFQSTPVLDSVELLMVYKLGLDCMFCGVNYFKVFFLNDFIN